MKDTDQIKIIKLGPDIAKFPKNGLLIILKLVAVMGKFSWNGRAGRRN